MISGCVLFFSAEKPLPQIATGDVISVIALLLAAGVLMGITITVLVLKIRSRNKQSSYVHFLFYAGTCGVRWFHLCSLFFPLIYAQQGFTLQKTLPANQETTRRWCSGKVRMIRLPRLRVPSNCSVVATCKFVHCMHACTEWTERKYLENNFKKRKYWLMMMQVHQVVTKIVVPFLDFVWSASTVVPRDPMH